MAIVDCHGDLSWSGITPGENVVGGFTIENAGGQGSLLNWEVTSYPNWGTWTITPDSGTNLPSGETVTVNVNVVAPNEPESQFTGTIKIQNIENSEDYDTASVTLSTPKIKTIYKYPFIYQILQKIILKFPILAKVLLI